ncbi:hypothetical protein DFH06DRAFT_1198573 [Mycena polygramma]|nr:hypothetical protein DFH06DRAFT_1198573 [Mycena polygramma]
MLDVRVTNESPSSRGTSPPADTKEQTAVDDGEQTRANDRDVNLDPAAYNNFESTQQMPHPMSSTAQSHTYAAPSSKQRRSPYERPTSPPRNPGSPAPSAPSSLDRSSVSTPPVPPSQSHQQPNHYAAYDPRSYPGGYTYAAPPAHYQPHPEGHQYPAHAQYRLPYGYVAYPHPSTVLSVPQWPGGGGTALQVIHTDDAATKLSDRVRRRCFNCCTTDTSTWRRSNLSPGKVLCNKCGLFERTHSRPRPEQFPHKRGPLASSTLRSRSPPPAQNDVNGSASHPGTPKQQHQNGSAHPSRPASRDGRAEESSVRDCK